MAEINHAFRESVTSVSFNLSLSRRMVLSLAAIADEQRLRDPDKSPRTPSEPEWKRHVMLVSSIGRNDTVGPAKSLERRGLIYAPDKKWPGIFCLTEAGEHVLELLKIAGVIVEVSDDELGKINRAVGEDV